MTLTPGAGPRQPPSWLIRPPAPADYDGCPVTVDEAKARGRVLRAPGWGIPDALLAIFGTITLAVVVASVLISLRDNGQPLPVGVHLLLGLVVPWLALAGVPLLFTRWRGNGPRIDLGLRLRGSDVGWGLLGGVAAIALGLLAGLLTQWLFGDFTSAAGDAAQEVADSGQRAALTVFAVLVVVGAPAVEELAFRGLFFAALRKRGLGAAWTVATTAVAFALFHFEPRRLLVLLVIGAVLGVVRWRTRALSASIIAHGVNNLPGAIALLALQPG
ncbi:MAG: CPBP family intramembrane metalloprotease [Actinomycetota bacterium]|nr:MAG: CPBP family intramembrane metalloprotease [Actinomycetota bacterium]